MHVALPVSVLMPHRGTSSAVTNYETGIHVSDTVMLSSLVGVQREKMTP